LKLSVNERSPIENGQRVIEFMFCPKCGKENPETGKFCRSCGTDLGNVSSALSGQLLQQPRQIVDHKGRPLSWDKAIVKMFTGVAFIVVAIALSFSIGKGWWFWMLIPGFTSLGAGVAQLFLLKRAEKANFAGNSHMSAPSPILPNSSNAALPPQQTEFVPAAESRYKTDDLVPPSVTDSTTKHLEMNSEGETMTLPKI
jgi:hypothetical protein